VTAPVAALILSVIACLVAMLAIAAKPEVQHRLRKRRRGGDLTDTLTMRSRGRA
jgi:hypothetical protein